MLILLSSVYGTSSKRSDRGQRYARYEEKHARKKASNRNTRGMNPYYVPGIVVCLVLYMPGIYILSSYGYDEYIHIIHRNPTKMG